MNYKKGISIIIPVYNAEQYIRTCVASIAMQSFKDIEIIFVIDKNSTDNSANILKSLIKNLNDAKIIYATNGEGAGYNRNIAIKQATREYIGFVDADDYIAKNYFELLYNNIKKYNADVAMGDTIIIRDKQIDKIYKHSFQIATNIKSIYSILKFSTVWDKIYRTKLIQDNENIRFAENVIHEDNIFILNLFLKTNNLVTTPNAYYYWTKHSNSATATEPVKWKHDAEIVFNEVLEQLANSTLTQYEKYIIIVQNIKRYAIELFKEENLYNYYIKNLINIIGKEYTDELIQKIEQLEKIKF